MTSMSITAQPTPQLSDLWITAQEQIDRLLKLKSQPIAYEIAKQPIHPTEIGDIANPNIASIISEYAVDDLSKNLTHWHTALKLLDALPNLIPPLPQNIDKILSGKCPINNKRKQDRAHYKVEDTHFLYLDPFPSVNALAENVSAYGKQHYQGDNLLQFRHFYGAAQEQYGNVESNKFEWRLILKGVLPRSRNKTYQEQAQMVAKLRERACAKLRSTYIKSGSCRPLFFMR